MKDFFNPPEIQDEDLEGYLALKKKERFKLAIWAGMVSSLLGGILWNWFTWFSGAELDTIADVNAILIGASILYIGKGISPKFGYLGAFFSVLSWIIGRFLNEILFFNKLVKGNLLEWLSYYEFSDTWEIFSDSLSIYDLFIVFAAISLGYYFSFKKIDFDFE